MGGVYVSFRGTTEDTSNITALSCGHALRAHSLTQYQELYSKKIRLKKLEKKKEREKY